MVRGQSNQFSEKWDVLHSTFDDVEFLFKMNQIKGNHNQNHRLMFRHFLQKIRFYNEIFFLNKFRVKTQSPNEVKRAPFSWWPWWLWWPWWPWWPTGLSCSINSSKDHAGRPWPVTPEVQVTTTKIATERLKMNYLKRKCIKLRLKNVFSLIELNYWVSTYFSTELTFHHFDQVCIVKKSIYNWIQLY